MTRKTRRYWLPLFIICLVGLLLRLYRLDDKGIWFDELATLFPASAESVQELVEITGTLEKNPPLHHVLIHYWMGASNDLFWLRLSSVLFGVGTIFAIAALGRLYGENALGLSAGLIAAVNPFLITHAQEVRMYALFGLGSAAATWLLARVVRARRNRASWIAYAEAAVVTLWTHYLFALLYFAQSACILLVPAIRRAVWTRWLRWQLLTVALFATLVPYFLFNIQNLDEGTAPKEVRWFDPLNLFRHLALAYPNPQDAALFVRAFTVAAAILFGLLLLIGLRHAARNRQSELILLLFIPPGVVFVASLVVPIYNPRYFIMIAPVFCLLLARGALSVRWNRLRPFGLPVVVLFSFVSLAYYYHDGNYRRADYARMDAVLSGVDADRVYHFDYESFLADRWYGAGRRDPMLIRNVMVSSIPYWEGRSIIPADRVVLALPRDAKGFWVVVRKPIHTWETLRDVDQKLIDKLGKWNLQYVIDRRDDLHGLTLLHLKRP